jgi:predicted HicB family RNase H-like nuclease
MSEEKSSRKQPAPYPLRMDDEVRVRAAEVAKQEDRSLNWVINDRLKAALGLRDNRAIKA